MAEHLFGVETVWLDLPALAGAFSRRLHDAGVPSVPERSAAFAQALTLVRPVSRRRLYWTARAVFVTDSAQVKTFDAVYADVFGSSPREDALAPDEVRTVPVAPDERPQSDRESAVRSEQHQAALASASSARQSERGKDDGEEIPVPIAPSDEEVLRDKRFDALEPAELAQLYRLMSRLEVAPPTRRTRRARRDQHGERIDLRRTLRGSLRTGGDPVRIARRRRRIVRRRLVLLCDISGSMEPYARAYLQFLSCAAGPGRDAEAFVFATRLTRVTRALASRSPDRAIQRAAAAAPDWSSGTRIGDALKAFNDRHGRRGMARGAVIVILSDGWERGDPALVGREMERLARLAHRIVWVNPRASATGFAPRTGGMAAALPHCDALVSGHSLATLDDVIAAIGASEARDPSLAPAPPEPEPEEEPWGSATPVPGSSVAMPSGYSPSRGRTTPGWEVRPG
ncbi:MAG TPA: VWA domain-containing protein [Solirubrobacteraceae bacterium]|nr:VWA domain-containing protein [Solirubrobacteraceae bacterium]